MSELPTETQALLEDIRSLMTRLEQLRPKFDEAIREVNAVVQSTNASLHHIIPISRQIKRSVLLKNYRGMSIR